MHQLHALPFFSALGAVILALAASTAFVTTPAQARERQTHISGSNGHSATRYVQRAGGDVSSSSTGVNGKSSSRSADRSAEGTQATVVGPNGQTRSRHSERDGQGKGSTTVTRATGGTVTREATRNLP